VLARDAGDNSGEDELRGSEDDVDDAVERHGWWLVVGGDAAFLGVCVSGRKPDMWVKEATSETETERLFSRIVRRDRGAAFIRFAASPWVGWSGLIYDTNLQLRRHT
jgi:hypothetical protein